MAFQAPDFFAIDSMLSSEERQVRDSVRAFVDREVLPQIDDWFVRDEFPRHLIPVLGEMGLFGATIQGYGCAGASYTEYGLMMQELERGDSGLRSFVSVQGALAMHAISAYGTEEQRRRYLPRMATGELLGCFGLTEHDFGSNPAGLATTARQDGAHYVLNGAKMWITSGSIADLAIVWAKVPEAGNRIHGFIVEKGTPGLSAVDIKKKFSLRASVTSELHLQDVRVPVSQRLDVVGLKGPVGCLEHARYGIAWGALGAAMACFDEAVRYAKTRVQFDRPIAGFQLVQAKLANILTEITKGQLLALQLGRLKDKGQCTVQQVSMAKMNNVRIALEAARTCRDILGGAGITHEYQCGRHMLNLESVFTYEGTDDIHRLILGQAITGLDAFRAGPITTAN